MAILKRFFGKKEEPESFQEYYERKSPRGAKERVQRMKNLAEAQKIEMAIRRKEELAQAKTAKPAKSGFIKSYTKLQRRIIPLRKSKKYQGKTGQRGRGRHRGSYKYYIPGVGRASVFQWRRYISQQKQAAKAQLQALKLQQQGYTPYETQYTQPNHAIAPNQQGRLPKAVIPSPQYEQYPSDLKVWEDMPGLGLNPTVQQQSQYYYEKDLATGRIKLRKGGSFL